MNCFQICIFVSDNTTGFCDLDSGFIVIYTNKLKTAFETESTWWHENTHLAYDAIELPDKKAIGLLALEYVKKYDKSYKDLKKILRKYKKEQLPQEGACRFIQYVYRNWGVSGILYGDFVGNEKIAKLATAIQNYFRYGETSKEETDNRLRQSSANSESEIAEPRTRVRLNSQQGRQEIQPQGNRGDETQAERGRLLNEVGEPEVSYGKNDEFRSKKNLLEDLDIPEIIANFEPSSNMNTLPKPLGVLENADAVEWVERHKESLLKRCRELANPKNVLDPDEVRNILQLIGYNGRNVPEYKVAGNILVDELFKRQMADAVAQGNPTITFMSGIGGAGKGTTLQRGGIDTSGRGVVYDAAFNDHEKLYDRMEKSRDAGMTDIEVIIVHNDGLTAFKNTVNRGKKIGRFLGINYFLESYAERKPLLWNIAEKADKLGVNVTIRPLDNAGNNGRGSISIDQALDEWDYNSEHYQNEILKYIYDELQQGRLTKDQATSITGDLPKLVSWLDAEGKRLAKGITGAVQQLGEQVPRGERPVGLGVSEDVANERGESYRSGNDDVIRFESHAEQLSLFGNGETQPTKRQAERQKRVAEMSDAELLKEMQRDIAELDKAGRADWGVQTLCSQEYDKRHIKEYNAECDAVRKMLEGCELLSNLYLCIR